MSRQPMPRGMGGGRHHGMGIPVEKPRNTKGTLLRLVRYISSSRHLLFLLLGTMLFITLLHLVAPLLQGKAIDQFILSATHPHVDFSAVWKILILLGATYLLSSLCTYIQGVVSAKLSQTTVRNLRRDLFRKMTYLSIRYMDTHRHGDLMSRMTNDVENVSNAVSQSIGSLISGVLTIVGTLVIMLWYSPLLTLVSLFTVACSILITGRMTKYMRRYYRKQQEFLGELNGHVEEMVTGYRTVVAFSQEEKSCQTFCTISNRLQKAAIRAQVLGGSMGPLMNFIGNMGFLLIATFGGYLVLRGNITVGIIQAFIFYSKQFTRPISEIAQLYGQIQTAIAGAERVFAVMDQPSETDEGEVDLPPEKVQGNLSFQNIDFSYVPGEPVLKNFNMQVQAGQKVAIVGATGSGKTTVVNLLTRFYDVDQGKILLDGIDIRDIPKKQLRDSIGIVLQDTVLFSDSIRANILYGNQNAGDEEMKQAAKTANADLFIRHLTEEYDTVLRESGGDLSQGQRQLLSIARAVLKDPKILILDEATSSVDTRTELHIQEAMIALMKNRTNLIIAHRLSTIRDADVIVVLEDGQVVESGNHEELLAKQGSYYRLYQNQFAGIRT